MGVFREEFWTVCKAVAPFVALMLGCLYLLAVVPEIALFFTD